MLDISSIMIGMNLHFISFQRWKIFRNNVFHNIYLFTKKTAIGVNKFKILVQPSLGLLIILILLSMIFFKEYIRRFLKK